MSRVITAIIMFIAIVSLAITESAYTINVANKTADQLETALEAYKSGDKKSAEHQMKEVHQYWKDCTPFLNAFLIHDNTDDIAEKISTAESTLKYESEDFPIECEKAQEAIDVVIYSMLPYFDNIL